MNWERERPKVHRETSSERNVTSATAGLLEIMHPCTANKPQNYAELAE